MTIYLNNLDKATAKRIENYVKGTFIPSLSENLSGGSWSTFKCDNIVLAFAGLMHKVEIKIGDQELFADGTGSKLYKLLEETRDYHMDLWKKEQRDKANKIMDTVCP